MTSEPKRTCALLVGFGEPSDPPDVARYMHSIFSSPLAYPLGSLERLRSAISYVKAFWSKKRNIQRFKKVAWETSSYESAKYIAERLEKHFERSGRHDTRVEAAMLYGDPYVKDVLTKLAQEGVWNLIVIPMFPHGMPSNMGVVQEEVQRACDQLVYHPFTYKMIRSWNDRPNFISAWADAVKEAIGWFPEERREKVHFVFASEAISQLCQESVVDNYIERVNNTADLIMATLGVSNSSSVAYQPFYRAFRWKGPLLEDKLESLGKVGIDDCLIIPISCVYDDVLTWSDIDASIIAAEVQFGLSRILRVTPPKESDKLIEALAGLF